MHDDVIWKLSQFFEDGGGGGSGTFVVISRLETRMSIRLMEVLNGSKEQYNSQSSLLAPLLRGTRTRDQNFMKTCIYTLHRIDIQQLFGAEWECNIL